MCHTEALEFIDNHNDLQSIQIQEKQVISALQNVPPGSFWQAEVRCKPDLFYQYVVHPQMDKENILLTVEKVAEGSR